MTVRYIGAMRGLSPHPHVDESSPHIQDVLGASPPDNVVADYLDSGSWLGASSGTFDVTDPRIWIGPQGMITDGTWYWPSELGYYVRRYGVPLPVEFIEHAYANRVAPKLSARRVSRIGSDLVKKFSDTTDER